ncbi:hypothetical protein BC827DRAFT_910588 [Russula dissimulans]|nr:hypothetical protein BC827DRAFT_910588 [Russula dissimulans]
MRDVAASHDAVIHLFERIHFFLERLNIYIGIPLTNDLTALLGNVMAHLLVILALSTKVMMDGRMKKILKRLVGKKEVEDALERLDVLTKEEISMTVARNLKVAHDIDGHMRVAKRATDELKWNQLQEKFRTWLSPPDPSINHNTAYKTQHSGTVIWFIQGNTLREWKQCGSLLWIRSYASPTASSSFFGINYFLHFAAGAGKSILCSAIIEDVKNLRGASSTLIAYY